MTTCWSNGAFRPSEDTNAQTNAKTLRIIGQGGFCAEPRLATTFGIACLLCDMGHENEC